MDTNILVDFYVNGKLFASRILPSVPIEGDEIIFKTKHKAIVEKISWVLDKHTTGSENYVNVFCFWQI